MQVGEFHPLDFSILNQPAEGHFKLYYPPQIGVWLDGNRTQALPSGGTVPQNSTALYIEALSQVSAAVISLEYYRNWNRGIVDKVVITAGTIAEADLDVDSNNNGTIDHQDDPVEDTLPGKQMLVNGDDDNVNGIADRLGTPTLGVENDLVPLQLSDGLPTGANRSQHQLYLSAVEGESNVRIWENRGGTFVGCVPKRL